ncbi:Heterokaryon incompatibility 6-like protein [Cladobotryum mycophilum]|uniref:Heterokaryon incompatibility 6-like protein n=1 Tax=Cladobotryum mycophilum TaxID=491253 RepID=A0ABR0SAW5_9HYPO
MAELDSYPKLSDQRSIRVIKLHGASNPDDLICFDLITVSLNAPPAYEALSYTWGGQPLDQLVYANGREYHVTGNTRAAMRRLRPNKLGAFRYLWIDAICINQRDTTEKSSQVQMMDDIFANAERVNIWLGEGNNLSAFIMMWIRFLSLPISPFNFRERIQAGVAYMASREYWQRIWTIQEARANSQCFALCGSSMPLDMQSFYMGNMLVRFFYTVYDIHKVSPPYYLHDNFSTLSMFALRNPELNIDVLDSLCLKKSTLEVDKIFAVRALFPQSLGKMTVDYSQSTSDIFTNAAYLFLGAEGRVEFFRYACHGYRNDGFPSWVPAWTTPTNIPKWLGRFGPKTISKKAVFLQGEDKRVLRLGGIRVDTATAVISELFPINPPPSDPKSVFIDLIAAEKAFTVFRAWIDASVTTREEGPYPWLIHFTALLAKISDLDEEKLRSWLPRTWYESDYGIGQPLPYRWGATKYLKDNHEAREFTREFLKLTSGRSLFTTKGGRVGMSTLVIREGDEVALLTGETLPYLIRQCPDQPGKYTLVAPCWLSGAVDGEPWPLVSGGDGVHPVRYEVELENLEYIELV